MQINSYILKPGGEPLLTPVINTITNKTNNAGTSRTINPSITAASTTSFTYTWSATGLPSGITIRASDGRISGTINSSLNTQIFNVVVTVSVTNGSQTKTDTELFNWTVNKVLEGQQNTQIQRSAGYNNATSWHNGQFGAGGSLEFSVSRAGDRFSFTWNDNNAAQRTGASHTIPDNWVVGNGNNGWQYSGRYLVLGNGLTSIGNNAFSFLIGNGYFQGGPPLYGLRIKKQNQWPDLIFPGKLRDIGNSAFRSRISLFDEFDNLCSIPGNVTKIGNDAFNGVWIKKLVLKEGLKTISTSAFQGRLGDNNLGGNGRLDQPLLKIPDSVTRISINAISVLTLYAGDLYIGPNLNSDFNIGIRKGTSRPFKNLYIKANPNFTSVVAPYAGYTDSSSQVLIHPDYWNAWRTYRNGFPSDGTNFRIITGLRVEPTQWSSFPDAVDGAWLGEDWEIT